MTSPASGPEPTERTSVASAIGRRGWLGSVFAAVTGAALDGCEPPSPVRSSVPTRAFPETGPVRLDANENPFGPSLQAVDAVRQGMRDLARYVGEEADALTRQLAVREGVAPSQIVLGEILEVLGTQLALEGGPGGEFVYSIPGYTALTEAARFTGGVAVGVPLDDRLENDLPALASHVNARTRALFLVNPHNPSGTVSDAASFKALVKRVATGVLVVVDEAYLEFTPDFTARTCVDLVREGHDVAVFRTFSKVYGLAAMPFGYGVLPEKWADRLREQGVGHARSLNRLAVVAAGASLTDAAYLATVRELVAHEREVWFSLLRRLKVRFADSRGNFVFFETGRPHPQFAAAMLARGVNIGRPFPPLDRWARVSIGTPEENSLAQQRVREILG